MYTKMTTFYILVTALICFMVKIDESSSTAPYRMPESPKDQIHSHANINNTKNVNLEGTVTGCPSTCNCLILDNELFLLNCSKDPLDALPELLQLHPHLVYLMVKDSHLSGIPCQVSSETKLMQLSLHGNDIKTISCDLSQLVHIYLLDLSSNKIQTVPCQLSTLPNVEWLNLSRNNISAIPCDLANMTVLQLNLSHNALSVVPHELLTLNQLIWLDLSHNFILMVSFEPISAMPRLLYLYLHKNRLHRLPHNITGYKVGALKHLTLGGNPWVCDCQALYTKNWMITHSKLIEDKTLVSCNSPLNMKNKNLIFTDSIYFCPNHGLTKISLMIITLVVSSSAAVFICMVFILRLRKRHWNIGKTKARTVGEGNTAEEDDNQFDVFVTYATEDEDYVDGYLIPELENHGFKVCYHRVNFCAGVSIIDNIAQSINNSKRTLAFFTRFYRESRFCMWEYKEALNKDMREGSHYLITIKDTDLNIHDLDDATRSHFERFTYIEKDSDKFWENLLFSLPKLRVDAEDVEANLGE